MLSRADEERERSYQRNGVSQCHFGCREFCLFSFAVCSVYSALCDSRKRFFNESGDKQKIIVRLVKEKGTCNTFDGSSVMGTVVEKSDVSILNDSDF